MKSVTQPPLTNIYSRMDCTKELGDVQHGSLLVCHQSNHLVAVIYITLSGTRIYLTQGCPILRLDGHCPARFGQRLSNYWEIWGSILFTIVESVTINLDHVCLDNIGDRKTHYSFDVTEFQRVVWQSILFMDIIGMNKCHNLNPTGHKKSIISLIKFNFM